ncbi:MAG: AgmX/PglI C-terminal domain-containing protein [Archangiaceae bacterium]|nr:AgmX/PglI C-terminal domain-containing protein [Archangiaceae bacterium]
MTTALCIALALSLAGAGAKKKETTSATQKDAIKGAIAADKSEGSAAADGGTAAADAPPREGPDVSKMPFTPESVKTVVAYWQPRIQTCYEETLAAKDKDVQGTLHTKWVVSPDGIVKKAEVIKKGTTLKDPKLHECVVTVLSSMTFPKTATGKDQPIEFPFNLKAVH